MSKAASMPAQIKTAFRGKRNRTRAEEILARWGLASVGLSFALVGILALLAALSVGGAKTDRQGALARIAATGWGAPILIVVAIGFAGYAVWRFVLAFTGESVESDEEKNAAKRVGYAARGLFYSGMTVVTVRLLLNRGNSGGSSGKEAAKVLGWPGGTWIVGAVGIAFIIAGLFNGYRAISRKYLEQLKTWEIPQARKRAVEVIAGWGMFTRMVLFSIIGWFLIQAAADRNPGKTVGMDGALQEVAAQTYGRVLLGLVALGLFAYALYRAVEARYRKV